MRGRAEWRSEPRPSPFGTPSTPRADASRLRPGRPDRCVLATPRHPRRARRSPVLAATEAIHQDDEVIGSAAIMTATMMMIPMLMAAITTTSPP
jgi:hypothetical protein